MDSFTTSDSRAVSFGSGFIGAISTEIAAHPLPGGTEKRVWTSTGQASTINGFGLNSAPDFAFDFADVFDTVTITSTAHQVSFYTREHVTGKISGSQTPFLFGTHYDVFSQLFDVNTFRQILGSNAGGFDLLAVENTSLDVVVKQFFPPLPPGRYLVATGLDLQASAPGSPLLTAREEFSVCSDDPGVKIAYASGATGDCGSPGDLEWLSLEPVQSVRDPSTPGGVRMIAGKDAVFRAVVKNNFTFPVATGFTFNIDQGGAASRQFVGAFTLPGGCAGPKVVYFPDPDPSSTDCDSAAQARSTLAREGGLEPLPHLDSPYVISSDIAPLDPSVVQGNTDKNHTRATLSVDITGLTLIYEQIACLAGACSSAYGSLRPGEYSVARKFSDLYMLALYPLAPADASSESLSEDYASPACMTATGALCVVPGHSHPCTNRQDFSTCAGAIADLTAAQRQAFLFDPDYDRFVAFFPAGYWDYQNYPTASYTYNLRGDTPGIWLNAEAVAGTNPTVNSGVHFMDTPHEIGHSFGLPDRQTALATPVGYWVGCQTAPAPLEFPNAPVITTCETPLEATELMGPGGRDFPHFVPPDRWITRQDYEQIRTQILVASGDPAPVLLILGQWDKDGTVHLDTMDEIPSGKIDKVRIPGDSSIDLLDDSGNIVSTTGPMGAEFVVHGDFVDSNLVSHSFSVPSSSSGIGKRVAYPFSVATVRFVQGGRVMLSVDPLSQTLRSAIKSIPDRGYAKDPAERRKALLNKVDAFESTMATKGFQGALGQLQNDVRDKVRKWIVEYSGQPDELSKEKVLDEIDRIAARIQYRMQHQP